MNRDPIPTNYISILIERLFSQACDDDPHAKLVGEVVELKFFDNMILFVSTAGALVVIAV